MTLVSRELVLKKVAATFPDQAEAEQALAALDRYKSPGGPEIVQLAIIKLSEGKLWKVRKFVRVAQQDFRDVLGPAQSPEFDRRMRQFAQTQRHNPCWSWGMLPPKRPSPRKRAAMAKQAAAEAKKEEAMRKREEKQWLEWLFGDA